MRNRLTPEQEQERFGMPIAAATALRDRVQAALSPKAIAAARQAWQDLAYELRDGKGQPMQTTIHPERVRFEILVGLDNGYSIAEAVDGARRLARENPLV